MRVDVSESNAFECSRRLDEPHDRQRAAASAGQFVIDVDRHLVEFLVPSVNNRFDRTVRSLPGFRTMSETIDYRGKKTGVIRQEDSIVTADHLTRERPAHNGNIERRTWKRRLELPRSDENAFGNPIVEFHLVRNPPHRR